MKELTLDYYKLRPGDLVCWETWDCTNTTRVFEPVWLQVKATEYKNGWQVWTERIKYSDKHLQNVLRGHDPDTEYRVVRPEGEPLEWLMAFLGEN